MNRIGNQRISVSDKENTFMTTFDGVTRPFRGLNTFLREQLFLLFRPFVRSANFLPLETFNQDLTCPVPNILQLHHHIPPTLPSPQSASNTVEKWFAGPGLSVSSNNRINTPLLRNASGLTRALVPSTESVCMWN